MILHLFTFTQTFPTKEKVSLILKALFRIWLLIICIRSCFSQVVRTMRRLFNIFSLQIRRAVHTSQDWSRQLLLRDQLPFADLTVVKIDKDLHGKQVGGVEQRASFIFEFILVFILFDWGVGHIRRLGLELHEIRLLEVVHGILLLAECPLLQVDFIEVYLLELLRGKFCLVELRLLEFGL